MPRCIDAEVDHLLKCWPGRTSCEQQRVRMCLHRAEHTAGQDHRIAISKLTPGLSDGDHPAGDPRYPVGVGVDDRPVLLHCDGDQIVQLLLIC